VGRGEVIDYYREHAGVPVAEKFSFEFARAVELTEITETTEFALGFLFFMGLFYTAW
jgi:hypothetical protein